VIGFLNTLPTVDDTPPDAAGMGIARLAEGWRAVAAIADPADQLRVIRRHPALVRELPQPSALVQWCIAGRQPELLQGLALAPGVAEAVAPAEDAR
jgi:hypothetical protein